MIDDADKDDWSEAIAALKEHDRTGVWFAAEEVIAELKANIEARLADLA